MRIHWSLKQAALAALICFLIGAAGLFMLIQQGALDEKSVLIDKEQFFDGSRIESFSITTDTANTTFVRSDNSQLTVRLTGSINKADLPYADISGNSTSIPSAVNIQARTGKRFTVGIDVVRLLYDIQHGFRSDVKVVVELPDKAYKELRAKTDTGKLTLPEIQAETLELTSDTGDIILAGFTGQRLTASSDTGTIRLRHISGGLDLSSDTGDIILDLDGLTNGANVRSDTGDINITLNKAFPVKVDFESDIGKTTADTASGAFSFEWKEKHKLLGELGNRGPTIKARTDTGNIVLDTK